MFSQGSYSKEGWVLSGKGRFLTIFPILLFLFFLNTGCAHYPLNQPLEQIDRQTGYRAKFRGVPGNSEALLFYLTFSEGGTRAAAFAYGVLEELKKTMVLIDGKERRLLDEVDVISAVSGGSFTAGYYGLFGEGFFQDFEQRFLKKDIQGALAARVLLTLSTGSGLLRGPSVEVTPQRSITIVTYSTTVPSGTWRLARDR